MSTHMPPDSESPILFDACQEHSSFSRTIQHHGVAALMCWIEGIALWPIAWTHECNAGETNQQLYDKYPAAADRKRLVLDFLAASLNDTRAVDLNIGVEEYNWADHDWVEGAYTGN